MSLWCSSKKEGWRFLRWNPKPLLASVWPALLAYAVDLLIVTLAPLGGGQHVWTKPALALAVAMMGLTYLLGLHGLKRWLARINTRSSYVTLWWSYMATTLLVQQPLWLACQKFHLIASQAALDNMYFTLVTFLTIGYGDFVPLDSSGRIFAMTVGLLGTAHNVCFVAYLLNLGQGRTGGVCQE